MPIYIGERYLPGAEQKLALEQAALIRAAVQLLTAAGPALTLLSTTFVANEEWVFDLFEAPSADLVRAVYAASGVEVERVTEGIHLVGS
jgi:hypothetical protein